MAERRSLGQPQEERRGGEAVNGERRQCCFGSRGGQEEVVKLLKADNFEVSSKYNSGTDARLMIVVAKHGPVTCLHPHLLLTINPAFRLPCCALICFSRPPDGVPCCTLISFGAHLPCCARIFFRVHLPCCAIILLFD